MSANGNKTQDLIEFRDKLLQSAKVFKDQYGKPFALLSLGGKTEILPVESSKFESWVAREYEKEFKTIYSQASMIVNSIKAIIDLEGEIKPLYLRVAEHDGAFWYNLGETGKVIRIDSDSYQIADPPPILFRKSDFAYGQQEPVTSGGDAHKLLDFINLKNEEDKLLFLVTAISLLIPKIPYPVIAFHGVRGAAKSTSMRYLKQLIDPAKTQLSSLSKDKRDLIVQMSHNHLVAYDNIDYLTPTQSDVICQDVTGGAMSTRKYYTNDDVNNIIFQGAVALNGITLVVTRSDLLDRSVLFEMEYIPEEQRQSLASLDKEFNEAIPVILGGMFEALSKAMGILPNIKHPKLPRMADYSRWGAAIAVALGYTAEEFYAAYETNRRLASEYAINDNPLAEAIRVFMAIRDEWEGTLGNLYSELVTIAKMGNLYLAKRWPGSAQVLMKRIKEVELDLKAEGIKVIPLTRSSAGSRVRLEKDRDHRSADSVDSDDTKSKTIEAETVLTPSA